MENVFTSYTGATETSQINVSNCSIPYKCYDGHTGLDFKKLGDGMAYSVANGKIVYRSDFPSCTTSAGFGCSVIVKYDGSTYLLYAHLDDIFVNLNDSINVNTQIGTIGETGDANGKHLHFAVLKPVNNKLLQNNLMFMSKRDWEGLLNQISISNKTPKFKSYCTYTSPIGISFAFEDPSGWFGNYKDPWGESKNKNGCNINSRYFWKYNIL